MKYRVSVKSLQGKILTFKVNEYKVEDGFVTFTDNLTGKLKKFAHSNCEINECDEEVKDD